ncbi:MAG: DUF1304 family protein [Rhodopirellula sp.]|nr:DUF1304 family protein [Rhodopirellula sp.]
MMKTALALNAVLHLGFVCGEMFPWQKPAILANVLEKKSLELTDQQLELVSTIVHNAGIYNLILSAGFVWMLFPGLLLAAPANAGTTRSIQAFFFGGAVVAGLFGLTLSPATAIQAACGAFGLLALRISNSGNQAAIGD